MQFTAAIAAPPDGRRLAWCASARSGSTFFLEGILARLVVRVTDYVPRDEVGIALGAQAAVFGAVGLGAPLERNWSIAAVHQLASVDLGIMVQPLHSSPGSPLVRRQYLAKRRKKWVHPVAVGSPQVNSL